MKIPEAVCGEWEPRKVDRPGENPDVAKVEAENG